MRTVILHTKGYIDLTFMHPVIYCSSFAALGACFRIEAQYLKQVLF